MSLSVQIRILKCLLTRTDFATRKHQISGERIFKAQPLPDASTDIHWLAVKLPVATAIPPPRPRLGGRALFASRSSSPDFPPHPVPSPDSALPMLPVSAVRTPQPPGTCFLPLHPTPPPPSGLPDPPASTGPLLSLLQDTPSSVSFCSSGAALPCQPHLLH